MWQPWLDHSSRLDSSFVSDVGLGYTKGFWQRHVVHHLCVLVLPGCHDSVFQKVHWHLTPAPPAKLVCFSNVRSWWENEAALIRGYYCFPRKMEWRLRKRGMGEHKQRWWLLSIISQAHSTSRGNSEALSFCWSILLFWEGQHNTLSFSLSLHPSLAFSVFPLSLFYRSVCHLVSILLQIILEVKSMNKPSYKL